MKQSTKSLDVTTKQENCVKEEIIPDDQEAEEGKMISYTPKKIPEEKHHTIDNRGSNQSFQKPSPNAEVVSYL